MKCNPAVATIAIDLAKSVFQVLAVDAHGKVLESHRLSRAAFLAFWHNLAPVPVVMEACGSAHHFGRWLSALGHQVKLPTIGWVTATAVRASIGDTHRFEDGRVLASWLGMTPREHSSGSTRQLGRMSKCGDVYCRTLLIQDARAVLAAAKRAHAAGKPLDRLRTRPVALAERRGFNKAAVGLANTKVRIIWATWHHARPRCGKADNYADPRGRLNDRPRTCGFHDVPADDSATSRTDRRLHRSTRDEAKQEQSG